ncbi:MAG: hypothetical protein QM778_22750 [Myxococcales bacterium]
MHARSVLWPTLAALGLTLAACSTDSITPKFPGIELPPFGDDDAGIDGSTDGVDCDGDEVGTEDSRTRYKEAAPAAGQTCMEETQTRTCLEDGTWSDWSGTYRVISCDEPGDAGGNTPEPCSEEGTSQSREMWDGVITQTDAGVEGECLKETQTRTCTGGVWGDWSGTYLFPQCPLTFDACDGQPHGTVQTQDRYAAATVQPDQECQKQTASRTCNDGTWSGWSGTAYTFETCEKLTKKSCDGQPDGTVRKQTLWETEEATQNTPCASQEQSSTCNDGTWSAWTAAGGAALFTKASCAPYGQKTCTNPDGGAPLAHGAKYTWKRYQTATVPSGQQCNLDSQVATCNNGVLDPYTGAFTFTSCTVLNPAACAADGGGTVPSGSTKTQTRWENARVAFNAQCVSEIQVSTCTDGTWGPFVGNHPAWTAAECKHNCDGGDHGATQSRTVYQDLEVAVPATCKSQDQQRTCSDGTWSVWSGSPSTYNKATCKAYCTVDAKKLYVGEFETRVRYGAAFPDAACAPQEQTHTCTATGMGNWTGTSTFLGCGQLPADNQSNVASCRWVTNNVPYCVQYKGAGAGTNVWDCVGTGRTWDTGRPCPVKAANNTAYGTCEYDAVTLHVTEVYYSVDAANKKTCDDAIGHDWTNL